MTLQEHLSPAQVAERLNISKSLVYSLISDGEIPSTTLGGRKLVPVDDLNRLLEVRKTVRRRVELAPRQSA